MFCWINYTKTKTEWDRMWWGLRMPVPLLHQLSSTWFVWEISSCLKIVISKADCRNNWYWKSLNARIFGDIQFYHLLDLQAWRGFHGNVYFEPISVSKASVIQPSVKSYQDLSSALKKHQHHPPSGLRRAHTNPATFRQMAILDRQQVRI